MRQTKIIATIGPASDTDQEIDALIAAGVDVFRINFSHGTRESQKRMYDRIRASAARADRLIAVMQDLAGPKIRTGRLAGPKPILLEQGTAFRISIGDIRNAVPCSNWGFRWYCRTRINNFRRFGHR